MTFSSAFVPLSRFAARWVFYPLSRGLGRTILVCLGLLGVAASADEPAFVKDWVSSALLREPVRSPGGFLAAPGRATTRVDDFPFAFTYGGKDSAQLLPGWRRTVAPLPPEAGKVRSLVTFTDPTTGLEIACTVTRFTDFPAVEWVLHLRNGGAADSPLLENIRPLDLKMQPADGPVTFHHSHGCDDEPTDFIPIDEPVANGQSIAFTSVGGRSSAGNLPFFNLEWSGGGLVGAIGWSGQWALSLQRDAATGLTVRAGQQTTHLRLHPGETIRTPSILLVAWEGADRIRGHNLLRRLLLAHYVPRVNGEIAVPPVAQMSWFSWNQGNDVTEANQVESMTTMADWGVEAYWLDAGWFVGGYPKGIGTWVPNPQAFPHGLLPVAEAAHRLGLKFILWFEPERATKTSQIALTHPEWVLPGQKKGGLLNLGRPEPRVWLTDFLSQRLRDWGVDVYRNDFNIDPLPFWTALDEPDRQGMSEIRYVEGLYQWWDDMRSRNPGLLIDNCASGGRRIDLETIKRSYPLWRNDAGGNWKTTPVLNQTLSAGLSLYVPLHASGVWELDPYVFRSVATTGVCFCMNMRTREFPTAQARQLVAEVKSLRPLYLGDYYPLTEITPDPSTWCAWQFDRPELGQGFALFFRRAGSQDPSLAVNLHGLEPTARYEVEWVDAGRTTTLTGSELTKLQVEIPTPTATRLVKYRKLSP